MQCFKIYTEDLNKRLDAYFYLPDHELNLGKHEIKTFEEISAKITDGDHGNPQYSDIKEGIPYLRVVDVKNNEINKDSIKNISPIYAEKLYKSCFAENLDLLVSMVGTLGESVLYKTNSPLAISRGFAIIKIKDNINPEYVLAFTKTYLFLKQIEKNKVGSVQNGIYLSSLKKIKIPVPSLRVQNKIVELMQEVYIDTKQKEQEAENLLNSIDSSVFEQLGIVIPEVKVKKCFPVRVDELEKRLDPLYYSQELLNYIKHSKNKIMTIGDVSEYLKAGFAAGKSDQDETDNGIIQIRPTNINSDRQLIFDKNIYIKLEDKEEKKNYLLKKGEVLFNNTNSQELVGKTVLFDLDGDYFCSNHITRIKIKESLINDKYLTLILNLYQRNKVFFNTCTNWNNQSGVNAELLSSFIIPVPDQDKQCSIAKWAEERIELAKQLQREAKEELEQAKSKVERIILGEEEIN